MKHRAQEKGFTALEAVVIIVVVVALGLGGWYIWQRNKDDRPVDTNTTAQTNNNQNNNEDQSDPSEGGKYLVIKEWGVRFLLPQELRGDVEYGVFTFDSGEQSTYFASKKLAAKSSEGLCSLSQSNETYGQGISGGTIAVARSEAKPEELDQRSFYGAGEYWYTLDFSQGGACYEGDTGQEKGRFNSLMDDSIRQLELVEQ